MASKPYEDIELSVQGPRKVMLRKGYGIERSTGGGLYVFICKNMFTLNGTGTRLYGKEKVNPDGSYVSTKWVTFFWIPLIPLGSFRIWEESSHNTGLITYSTETKHRMQKVALDLKQILKVYFTALLVLACIGVVGFLLEKG